MPTAGSSRIDRIMQAVHAAAGKRPESAEFLAFSESVLLVQERHQERLDPRGWGLDLDAARETDELPLIANHRFISESDTIQALFRDLIEIAGQGNEYLKTEMGKLAQAEREGKLAPARLLGADLGTLAGRITRTAKRLKVDRNAVAFLAVNALRPYYQAAAGLAAEAVAERRDLGEHCPVCGSLPVLATISGQEAQRHFFCYLCACRWYAGRLLCPYCGCRDHDRLRYIFAEDERRLRAYLCDNCKHYLKTSVSEDDSARGIMPAVEDLATTFLDLLAEREGYTRGVPTHWGI